MLVGTATSAFGCNPVTKLRGIGPWSSIKASVLRFVIVKMQQVECEHCGRTLDFAGERPRYCSYCGQSLSTFVEPEETLDAPASSTPNADSRGSSSPVLRGSREAENLAGKKLGEYRLIREIGRGGMGVVYEAEQLASSRRVAIKLLGPSVPHTSAATERFLREGKLAASLSHPRTTFVYDAGEFEGRYFIVMELMPGETLRDEVERHGPPTTEKAVDWALDVLDGLQAAHRTGIVHRDVKPSNCFLDSEGRVKVGDFGLSKSLVGDAELTSGGGFMGTPLYAAPEQLRGGEITARTDQYSLGATLFYLLCGKPPFVGDFATAIAKIVSEPAPTARSLRSEVPADLSRVIARMLEKDPARRFNNLHEIRTALAPFGSGGTSIATLGRRLAAFSLDYVGSYLVFLILSVIGFVMAVVAWSAAGKEEVDADLALVVLLSTSIGVIGYFIVCEGIWGRGFGKRLMGLRTVTLSGERVGFLRASIRSVFYPGILCLFGFWATDLTFTTAEVESPTSARDSAISNLWATLVSLLSWLICLLGLVTMRASNAYRGVHELLSGTRVMSVRSKRSTVSIEIPGVAGLQPVAAQAQISGFELQNRIAQTDLFQVFVGRDTSLERNVWVYVSRNEEGDRLLESLPVKTSRPAREQWLRGGRHQGRRWQAFDAVSAIPIEHAIATQRNEFQWGFRRDVLLELAEELRTAVDDKSLPANLLLEQVLVDEHGRLKLLNMPIHGASLSGEVAHEDAASAACHLLVAAFDAARAGQVISRHDQQLQAELAAKPANAATLDWVVAELRQAVRRPSRLTWDHRLGLLSISMFTEFGVYTSLIGIVAALPWLIPHLSIVFTAIVPAVMLALLPVVLGAFMGGGPVFRFAGVEVLTSRSGKRAGKLRCAWRSLLAWFPLVASMTGFGFVGLWAETLKSPGSSGIQASFVAMLVLLFAFVIFLLFVAGLIVALVSPRRGIQDLMAGTVLLPE